MATDGEIVQELLAEVFDLILFNADKIVDDTSLEKLLEILEFIYNNPKENERPTILKFFSQIEHVQCCAATISFALRLSGIICNSSEGFHVFCGVNNILEYLFHGILEKDELWADPGVRDSYFKAALGILRSNDGFLWIQNSGVLEQAMECLVDSSIFVADSARKFVAKYLVSLYNSSMDKKHNSSEMENDLQGSAKHDCFRAKTDTFSVELIMCHKCIVYHLKQVVEQLPTGLARTMSRQVSVTQLLLSLMEEDAITAQEMLHPSAVMLSCFKMLNYINKDECGKVIDVIFTMLNNTSTWQIDWTLLLDLQDKQDLFHTMFEFILILYKRPHVFVFHAFQLIQGVFRAGQSLKFDESDLCVLFMLLTFPVHATLHKMEESNHMECQSVKDVAKELLLTNCSTNDGYKIVHGILNETFKNFLSNSTVAQSLIVTTDVICDMKFHSYPRLAGFFQMWCKDIVEFLNEQSDDYFRGNTLTKLFIKAVTVCFDRGLFDDDTIFDGKKECYRLFVKLISVSQDSKIISSCFEGLKCLFSRTEAVFPCYVNIETLNKLLILHCSNSCWDVRDSTLIFLRFLLTTFNAGNVELLLDRKLLLLLWKLMEDSESYVRASSIYLLGVLSTHDGVWKHYCETISLSEEEVLNYIVNAFEQEEAAFARRATIDILSFWLERKHSIILMHLEEKSVGKVLNKASQDFDWEVKLCVLNFWETMVYHYCDKDKKTLSCIESSCLNEISTVILGAITDCYQPVRVKGLALLEELKTHLVELLENDVLHYNGSVDELHDFILQTKKDRNCSLLQTLLVIDFSEFAASFQVSNLMRDPFSFLHDILAAASENKDNLLDCY